MLTKLLFVVFNILLMRTIFQIICDSAKKVSPAPKNISIKNRKKSIDDKRITSFEKKMKINLKETLEPYLNQISEDKINNIIQSSTPLMFIENLINEKFINSQFEFNKKTLKKLLNIAELIIEKKEIFEKEENKAKSNKAKNKDNTSNDINDNYIKYDEKLTNNLFPNNYNADDAISSKMNIEGNQEQKGNIFIAINNKDSTDFESNPKINKNVKIKHEGDIKIREEHLINIIKNMIMKQFIKDFNKDNKSNYILKIKKEKTKKRIRK